MAERNLPVGTRLRSPAGNVFEKVAENEWRCGSDHWSTYSDTEVNGSAVSACRHLGD